MLAFSSGEVKWLGERERVHLKYISPAIGRIVSGICDTAHGSLTRHVLLDQRANKNLDLIEMSQFNSKFYFD